MPSKHIRYLTLAVKRHLLAIGLLFLLGILWGSGYALARYATTHGVHPLGYAFWQSIGPAMVITLITYLSGYRLPIRLPYFVFYLICGSLGIALPNTSMYFAASHLPSGLLAVIVNTVPIITYLLALAIKEEHLDYIRVIGIICAICGIMYLVWPKASLPTLHGIPWALVALITPFCFAGCAVYSATWRPQDADSRVLAAGMMICSSLLLTPIVLGTHHFYTLNPPWTLVDGAVVLEIALSSMGYIVFFQLLKIAGAVYYSLVSGVVALTGLFWGWFIFGETLNSGMITAVILIFAGISTVTLRQK